MERRNFLKAGALAGAGAVLGGANPVVFAAPQEPKLKPAKKNIVISTWRHGTAANHAAVRVLLQGNSALDAAVRGVMVSERDPEVTSVGYGGLPNREGVVELDAAVMEGDSLEAGAVAGVQRIKHVVALARDVMEKTPHLMLVGDGARRFAVARGYPEENLLTANAKAAWEKWKALKRKPSFPPKEKDKDNHDTIGMITMDTKGSMAASCTTSGAAWKLPGRVGDSPLIAHGLYCDSKYGGATATGLGEEVVKVAGSYQVVEFMRQGASPTEAVNRVIQRILDRDPRNHKRSVAFIALRADGEVGYGSTTPGFQAAIYRDGKHELKDSPALADK